MKHAAFDQIWDKYKNNAAESDNSLDHVPAWFAHFCSTEFKSVYFTKEQIQSQKLVSSLELFKML